MTTYRTTTAHFHRVAKAVHDPREPLATALAARELPVLALAIEREMVRRSRAAGASWADVGAALGMTRQAACERYGASI